MIFIFTRKHTLPQNIQRAMAQPIHRPRRDAARRATAARRGRPVGPTSKSETCQRASARARHHTARRAPLAAPSATRFSASLMFVCTHDRETRPLTNCAAAAAAAAASRATRTDARRSRQPRAESTPVCAFLCRSPAALRIRTRAAAEPRDNHKVFVLITPQRRLKASKPKKQLESQLSKERKMYFEFERRTMNSQEKKK